MSVTLKSISDQVGLSSMTVSRVLRGIGNVKPATREKILKVATEAGYPSLQGVVFPPVIRKGSNNHQLRLLLPEPRNSQNISEIEQDVIDGLNSRLNSSGGKLIHSPIDSWDEVWPIANDERVHGIILRHYVPQSYLDKWKKRFHVVYGTSHDFQSGVDSVYANENRCASAILENLLRHGHTRIVFMGILDKKHPSAASEPAQSLSILPEEIANNIHSARYAVWSYFASLKTKAYDIRLQLETRDWKQHSLYETVARSLDKVLSLPNRPTAIVSTADLIAMEIFRQLKERGIRIPEDMSLSSYGGLAIARSHKPPLTSVELPFKQIGRCLPELVERRLAQPDALPVSLQLEPRLLPGGTVAAARPFRKTPAKARRVQNTKKTSA